MCSALTKLLYTQRETCYERMYKRHPRQTDRQTDRRTDRQTLRHYTVKALVTGRESLKNKVR